MTRFWLKTRLVYNSYMSSITQNWVVLPGIIVLVREQSSDYDTNTQGGEEETGEWEMGKDLSMVCMFF